ncbi:putative fatty acyl-CoA reductase CG5065 isoform X2 [Bradysia coprophila]|uniref:putative fatty acyl-CoA reductase CG5065 isoform X2 n=1 Tax=Bradysia coprophila TaxID=38358 RepID=UPI00187DCA07|nr:putative fatty acyl-CoA reductase CG5065 isoform X2 [Bradysia coprophila]
MSDTGMNLSPVQEFYKGQTIFITGGTGFMGKVLIEKLLYSCSELKEILILMRPKRGKVPEARLEDMFKLPIFNRIKDEKPEVLKKLVPVQGDVTFDCLGLSGEQMTRVCRDVSIVFHCAATLKLEANLKDAIDMNTTGTKRVLDLCKKFENLKALVHLSTAFCNCDQEVMREKVYDCPHNPDDIMRMAEWMDAKALDNITPGLLTPHPNTYTYSKRLAEILVQREWPNMPVAIARPSIVSPSWEEPVQGWVDSLNGPIGVMVGGGKGVIRSMLCDPDNLSEVIPVDIAINSLICIGWRIGTWTETARPKNVPVFNITCCESKKVTWRFVLDEGKQLCYKYPFEAGLWYPDGDMTTSKFVHTYKLIFYHWLPAYLIDFLMLCFGQKRFMCRIQTRISQGLELLQFFTTRKWDFRTEQFYAVGKQLSDRDLEIFTVLMDEIDLLEYMKRSLLGGRQYCLKEPLTSLPKARMQLRVLYCLDRFMKFLLLGLFFWAIYRIFDLKTFFENRSGDNLGYLKAN